MIARIVAAAALTATLATSLPADAAAGPVPVRIRIIKGSRGQAGYDAQLADLHKQLEKLSYTRWDLVGVETKEMAAGKAVDVKLPDGSPLTLTMVSADGSNVTFELKVPAQKTHSRLTITKEQRIVHQATEEKGGTAYFVTIRPWP